MRKLLQLPSDASRRVLTHSLKSTAISWCAKYGLCFESRALLSVVRVRSKAISLFFMMFVFQVRKFLICNLHVIN